MYKVLLVVIAGFSLSGCLNQSPSMSSVMGSCESRSNFTSYVNCIKTDYTRYPDRSEIRSLYARLNSINEDYENGSISETKARAAARIAYDVTVGTANARRNANAAASYSAPSRPMSCITTGNRIKTTNCF